MKILFAGGGSGGHFYPIIAIAQELNKIAADQKFLEMKMYYMAPAPFDERALFDNNLIYVYCTAGKKRRYFSILNFLDLFKIGFGILKAIWEIFNIFPDVVVGKGGYASFPAVVAARILRIPVIIHESDTVPGKVNKWAGSFARRIALGFPEAAEHFKGKNTAYTGNPVRTLTSKPLVEGAYDFLKIEEKTPTIAIFGGSQGAKLINDAVLDALPRLLQNYQVIHQTGTANEKFVRETAEIILTEGSLKSRYKIFGFLNELEIRMVAGVADVIISRAGAGAISDVSSWGTPSVLIPITDSNGDHQRKNAFAYARTGAAVVIEEKNLSANIIISEIERILADKSLYAKMELAARKFHKPGAARKIADEIIQIASEH